MAVPIKEISTMYEARAYSSDFAPQRLWHRKRVKEVLKMAGNPEKVLDVGCGSCILLENFSGKKYGVDLDAKTLKECTKENKALFLCSGSAEEIPFPDKTFDAVTCTEVLEHLSNPEKTIKEIQRVLKPGGHIVVSTPNYRSFWPVLEYFWSKKDGVRNYVDEHKTHFTMKTLSKSMESAGFKVEEKKTRLFFFPFASMLSEDVALRSENADDLFAKTGIGMLLFVKAVKQ